MCKGSYLQLHGPGLTYFLGGQQTRVLSSSVTSSSMATRGSLALMGLRCSSARVTCARFSGCAKKASTTSTSALGRPHRRWKATNAGSSQSPKSETIGGMLSALIRSSSSAELEPPAGAEDWACCCRKKLFIARAIRFCCSATLRIESANLICCLSILACLPCILHRR